MAARCGDYEERMKEDFLHQLRTNKAHLNHLKGLKEQDDIDKKYGVHRIQDVDRGQGGDQEQDQESSEQKPMTPWTMLELMNDLKKTIDEIVAMMTKVGFRDSAFSSSSGVSSLRESEAIQDSQPPPGDLCLVATEDMRALESSSAAVHTARMNSVRGGGRVAVEGVDETAVKDVVQSSSSSSEEH